MATSGSPSQKKDGGKFKMWWVLILVFVLLFLAFLGFMFFRRSSNMNKALPINNFNRR